MILKSIFKRLVIVLLALSVLSGCVSEKGTTETVNTEKLTLVKNGKSDYVIYIPPETTGSVRLAARELRNYIKKTTGAVLETTSQLPKGQFICLGFCGATKKAGLSMDGVMEEGFNISVRNGNIFIYGSDTPDGGHTPNGGISRGTLLGVYAFLEKFLGVRWLCPGPLGESVIKKNNILIPEVSIIGNPAFLKRHMNPARGWADQRQAMEWHRRMRLGGSLGIQYGHAWQHAFKKDELGKLAKRHPKWFAEIDGKRSIPSGQFKICTSNPEVIKYMAEYIDESFKKFPWYKGWMASPNDGAGFCECADCQRLDDQPLPKIFGQAQYTRRILNYYDELAKQVAKEWPDKWVCGYVYQCYMLPPEPPVKMAENVFLMFAPSFNYGIRFYVPEVRNEWHKLVSAWSDAIPGRWGYYDLPNQFFMGQVAAPQPPCTAILNEMLPALKKAHATALTIYSTTNWRSGGVLNYVNARMAWDPELDADELCGEYCRRAYGEAGAHIKRIYDLLEKEYQAFMLNNPDQGYVISPKALECIYGRNFPRLEKIFIDGWGREVSPKQRKRLELFKIDMIGLYRALKSMDMLPKIEKISAFDIADEEYAQLREKYGIKQTDSTADSLTQAVVRGKFDIADIKSSNDYKEITPKYHSMRRQLLAVQSPLDNEITIPVKVREYGSHSMSYQVFDANGKTIKADKIFKEGEISFFARENQLYFIIITSLGVSLDLSGVRHAWHTRSHKLDRAFTDGFLFALYKNVSPLKMYFYVPSGSTQFSVVVKSSTWNERAFATLYDPDGKETALFEFPADCKDATVKKIINAGKHSGKVWLLEANTDGAATYYIFLEDGLSGWFSLDPQNMLIFKN